MNIRKLKKKALTRCKGNWKGLVGITFVTFLLFYAISTVTTNSFVTSISSIIASVILGQELRGAISLGKNYILTLIVVSFSSIISFIFIKCLMFLRNSNEKIKYRTVKLNLSMIWNFIKYRLWILLYSIPAIIVLLIAMYPLIGEYVKSLMSYRYIMHLDKYIWIFIFGLIIAIIYKIWLTLTYGFVCFVIAEKGESFNARELMKEASQLVKGYKCKLLLIKLSFIGWYLLSILTLGIGCLWIVPYMELTIMEFYYELKNIKELEQKEVV